MSNTLFAGLLGFMFIAAAYGAGLLVSLVTTSSKLFIDEGERTLGLLVRIFGYPLSCLAVDSYLKLVDDARWTFSYLLQGSQ